MVVEDACAREARAATIACEHPSPDAADCSRCCDRASLQSEPRWRTLTALYGRARSSSQTRHRRCAVWPTCVPCRCVCQSSSRPSGRWTTARRHLRCGHRWTATVTSRRCLPSGRDAACQQRCRHFCSVPSLPPPIAMCAPVLEFLVPHWLLFCCIFSSALCWAEPGNHAPSSCLWLPSTQCRPTFGTTPSRSTSTALRRP